MTSEMYPGQFCAWKMIAGERLDRACPECGHAAVLHVGVDHCPVCELVWQATPEFRHLEERIRHSYPPRIINTSGGRGL